MKRFAPKNKNRSRRGFSVAEVIVALTVIVIVSAAAMVLIGAQIRADANAARTVAATNMAENAIECFRYACDTAEGENIEVVFKTAFGTEGCGYTVSGENGTYTATHNGLTCTVQIRRDEKTADVAVTTASGETVVSVKNYKG